MLADAPQPQQEEGQTHIEGQVTNEVDGGALLMPRPPTLLGEEAAHVHAEDVEKVDGEGDYRGLLQQPEGRQEPLVFLNNNNVLGTLLQNGPRDAAWPWPHFAHILAPNVAGLAHNFAREFWFEEEVLAQGLLSVDFVELQDFLYGGQGRESVGHFILLGAKFLNTRPPANPTRERLKKAQAPEKKRCR